MTDSSSLVGCMLGGLAGAVLVALAACGPPSAPATPRAACTATAAAAKAEAQGGLHRALRFYEDSPEGCAGRVAGIARVRAALWIDDAGLAKHAAVPSADAKRKAALLYRAGAVDRIRGDLAGALSTFSKSYALAPHPYTLVQIGLAHRKAGRRVQAQLSFERALALAERTQKATARPRITPRHAGSIRRMAFNRSGRLLATGGQDGAIMLWDVATGRQLRVMHRGSEPAGQLVFSADGGELAARIDWTIVVWDVRSGAELRRFRLPRATLTSEPMAPGLGYVAYAMADGSVVVLDGHGAKLRTLQADSKGYVSLGFDKRGTRIAQVTDTEVIVWNPRDGTRDVTHPRDPKLQYHPIAFSDTGEHLAARKISSKTIELLPANREAKPRSVKAGEDSQEYGFADEDQTLVNYEYDRLVITDVETGRERATIGGQGTGFLVDQWTVHPFGDTIAVGDSEGVLRVYDARSGKRLRQFGADTWGLNDVSFYDGGAGLLIASDDGSVKVWTPAHRNKTLSIWGHRGWVVVARAIAGGRKVISAGKDNRVRVIDLDQRKVVAEYGARVVGKGNNTVAFEPTNGLFAFGFMDYSGRGRRWGIELVSPTGWSRKLHPRLIGARIDGLAFRPGTRKLAVAGRARNRLEWILEFLPRGGGKAVFPVHSQRVSALAFSPDGTVVATSSFALSEGIRLWEVSSGKLVASLPGHLENAAVELAFSPDGKRLISVGRDSRVMIWDVATSSLHKQLGAHEAVVTGVSFAPSGRVFATSSKDRTIKLWSAKEGTLLATFMPERRGAWIAMATDGRVTGTPGQGGGSSLIYWEVGDLRLPGFVAWDRQRDPSFMADVMRAASRSESTP